MARHRVKLCNGSRASGVGTCCLMKKTLIWLGVILLAVVGIVFQAGRQSARAQRLEAEKKARANEATVHRSDILVQVIDTGIVDAGTAVEVKGRISGKLDKLMVQEGNRVLKGDLLATLEPIEYSFQVREQQAQVAGAKSSWQRAGVELDQRRKTAQAALDRARSSVASLEKELKAQPALTASAIQSASAALAQANATLAQLESTVQPTALVSAEANVDEAKSSMETAKREWERRSMLLAKGYVAEADVDNAKQQFDAAEAKWRIAADRLKRIQDDQRFERELARQRVRQASAELDRAKANSIQNEVKREQYRTALTNLRDAEAGLKDVDSLRFGQQQSRATYNQLSANLEHTAWQFSQTKVRSPLTGTVTRKYVQEGELVTGLSNFSAGTAIMRIEDRNTMLVKLNVNEIDIAKLKPGMKAVVEIDAIPNKKFSGRILTIAPTSMNLQTLPSGTVQSTDSVVKFQVEVSLENPTPEIRSGMNAKCTVDVINKKNVLTLPVEFVGKDNEGSFVELVKSPPGSKTRVTVGDSSGAKVEILSGVTEGTRVRRPGYSGPARQGMISAG